MKKQGFSLVELMISLIVISIITAAFAPVVTKKLKASGAAYIASGGSASTICTAIQPDGTCKLCTKNTTDGLCLLCEATCTKGQYLDYDQCSCHTCTDTNCELCSEKECLKCKKGYEPDIVTGTCVISCNDKDLIRIGDLCVTKYNMGDKRKFPIPDTVKMIRAGEMPNSGSKDIPTCWYGITANKDNCNSSNGSYSGCGRTVCNWQAAREICAKFSLNGVAWRLPTIEEAMTFENYTKNLKNEGLGLCGYTSSTTSGVARCDDTANNCYYLNNNYVLCKPYVVWTDTQSKDTYALDVIYYGSNFSSSYYEKTYASSVRCVQGGYPDISKQCTIADWNCERCSSDGKTCTKCKSGYDLENGVCEKNCGTNMYYDTTSYTCKACPSGRHYCDGKKLDPCASTQWGSSTKAICTTCGGFDGACSNCINGYLRPYRSSVYCDDCPANCTKCAYGFDIGKTTDADRGYCTQCDSGYNLTSNGYCEESCSFYDGDATGACLSCSKDYEKGCLSCKSGYGLAQMDGLINKGNNWRVCKKCPDHCTGCETSGFYDHSISACTRCESGYTLIGGSGDARCEKIPDCSSYDGTVSGTCLSCSDDTGKGCTSCKSGYGLVLISGINNKGYNRHECKACSISHCARCDAESGEYETSKCTQCESGYTLNWDIYGHYWCTAI